MSIHVISSMEQLCAKQPLALNAKAPKLRLVAGAEIGLETTTRSYTALLLDFCHYTKKHVVIYYGINLFLFGIFTV